MNKFDSPETEALYEVTLNGFQDDECGDVESTNWYGLVRGPFKEKLLKGHAGGIVEVDNLGFVYGRLFKTKKELDKKWKEISKGVASAFEGSE